jgi:hypothetical protein
MNLNLQINDLYITTVVSAHTPISLQNVAQIAQELNAHIFAWANGHNYELKLSGSLAKGTGITGTTDVDFFISLNPSVGRCNTLKRVYETLRNRFNGAGYAAREQNVSIGINHLGYKIDLVAGVKQTPNGFDHSIWKRKKQTYTKTNIDQHISHVAGSGRVFDIKAIKIWRKLWGLDFPSFYLELSVIEALRGKSLSGSPSNNFIDVMNYLSGDFISRTIFDPSNQGNEVSEELTQAEKDIIKNKASIALALVTLNKNLNQVIW